MEVLNKMGFGGASVDGPDSDKSAEIHMGDYIQAEGWHYVVGKVGKSKDELQLVCIEDGNRWSGDRFSDGISSAELEDKYEFRIDKHLKASSLKYNIEVVE